MTRLAHDWYPEPLPPNIRLGEQSWLYSSYALLHCRSTRDDAVVVGRSTGLYNGTFFDLGSRASVSIGDYTTLVGGIISTSGSLSIGSYVLIAHEVVIADRDAATPDAESGEAIVQRIDDLAWIGARAIIVGPVHIGEGAIVGAGALVRCDVEAYTIVAGNPARVVGRCDRKD